MQTLCEYLVFSIQMYAYVCRWSSINRPTKQFSHEINKYTYKQWKKTKQNVPQKHQTNRQSQQSDTKQASKQAKKKVRKKEAINKEKETGKQAKKK